MPTITELGAKVRAKYPGQYDDMDDATLGAKVKSKYPKEYADFADTAAVAPAAPVAPVAQAPVGAGAAATAPMRGLANFLPGAMGALGGLVPGPAGIGASAGLQGLGEVGRQTIQGQFDPGGVLKETAKGAAFGAAGGLAGKALGRTMEFGFAVGGSVAPKIAKTLMKYGVNVGQGRFGAEKLIEVNKQVASQARDLYKTADNQVGQSLSVQKIADALRNEAIKPGTSADKHFAMLRHADRLEKNYPKYLTPTQMRGLKQELQNATSYGGTKLGPIAKQSKKIMAKEARAQLVNLGQIGKEIEKMDKELGALKDATRALQGASNRAPGGNIGGFRHLSGVIEHPTAYTNMALLFNAIGRPTANLGTRLIGNAAFPPTTPRE